MSNKISYTLLSSSVEVQKLLDSVFVGLSKKFPDIDFSQEEDSQFFIDLESNDISSLIQDNCYYLVKMGPTHQKLEFFNQQLKTVPLYQDGFLASEVSYQIQKLLHLDPILPEVNILKDCHIQNSCWLFTSHPPQNNLEATTAKNSSISVKRLQQKIRNYDSSLLCTDLISDFVNKNVANNFVLFGSFLDHYIESLLYTNDEIYFSTLSTAAKQTLESLFDIEGIDVIPRENLYPAKKFSAPLQKNGVNWVYSGRLTEDKNLSLAILFFHHWQTKYDPQSTFTIFGSVQENTRNYFCKEDQTGHKQALTKMINNLDWITPPHFMGEYPDDIWMHYIPSNSCFLNFSTYCKDDFGVSTAQYLEKCNNALLSSWGGHIDVRGEGIYHVESELLLTDELSPTKKAKLLADQFFNKTFIFTKKEVELPNKKTLTLERRRASLYFFQQLFDQAHIFLNRGLSIEFAQTPPGKKLALSYSLLFQGIKNSRELHFIPLHEIENHQWINSPTHLFLDPIRFKLAQKLKF